LARQAAVVDGAFVVDGRIVALDTPAELKIARSQRNNKIQGLAAVRGLGMLIAGLPCLPWFIHSGGALVFGVLPPFWAAKAFWVASDHGTWWPFLLGGVTYNVAIALPLFRRFVAKST
jgi:fluoroquinolone transport system permease protein